MSSELSSLSLFAATPEQILASRKRTYPQWGRGLTEYQYLTRDAQMDPLEHAANGKLTTWVLAPRGDATTLDFRCSCETYRRRALVRKAGSEDAEEVIGYSIASVFTPPANRGKGYARHMMRLLHWVVAPRDVLPPFPDHWGSPPPPVPDCGNASFSALYSDVGHYYQSAGPDETSGGWVVRDPVGTVWDVSNVTDAPLACNTDSDMKWLDEEGAKELWKEDVKHIAADMSTSPSPRTLFTFLPDGGVGAFQIRRTVFYLPGQPYPMPRKWGVVLDKPAVPGTDALPTFATWTLDIRPPPSTLIITRLRATPATFARLIARCIEAARECQMERVEVWNLPKDLVVLSNELGGKTEHRDEHLNAFKWYGPEKDDEVEWLFNEKFSWS